MATESSFRICVATVTARGPHDAVFSPPDVLADDGWR